MRAFIRQSSLYCIILSYQLRVILTYVITSAPLRLFPRIGSTVLSSSTFDLDSNQEPEPDSHSKNKSKYFLSNIKSYEDTDLYWNIPTSNRRLQNGTLNIAQDLRRNTTVNVNYTAYVPSGKYELGIGKNTPIEYIINTKRNDNKKIFAKDRQLYGLTTVTEVAGTTFKGMNCQVFLPWMA